MGIIGEMELLKGIAGCIDVETTGLSSHKDEIVELALVLFRYDDLGITGIVDSYSSLREPSCPISREAYRAHGLSKQKLKGRRLDEERILNMIGQTDFLVAHNASFDRGFITTMFPSLNGKRWYCSMSGVKWSGGKNLQRLLSVHGIEVEQAHRALDDVHGVINLLSKDNRNGKTYFAEMLQGKPLTDRKQAYQPQVSKQADHKKGGCLGPTIIAIVVVVLIFVANSL
jgi:DNA polymerase III subunit epsilon